MSQGGWCAHVWYLLGLAVYFERSPFSLEASYLTAFDVFVREDRIS